MGEALNLAAIFLLGRLVMALTLPVQGLQGYGDLVHFYRLAELGRPFLDYWVEFPPLFPLLSRVLYLAVSGREHAYDYLLYIVFSIAQAGTLFIFSQMVDRLWGTDKARKLGLFYAALLLPLGYGWWYFDPLANLALMAGVWALLQGRPRTAGLALGLGALTKWFPLLALPLAWRFRPRREAFQATAIALALTAGVWAMLYAASPDYTLASLASQPSKGSWETVWALLDGNLGTGNFGPELERLDPALAAVPRGAPAVVSPLITLAIALSLGGWAFLTVRNRSDRAALAFLGLTWSIYSLWSPGWSPQWVLYWIPVLLLAMPGRRGVMLVLDLVLLSLLEWPILLSRGRFDLLWVPVALRTVTIVLVALSTAQITRRRPLAEARGGL